MKIKITGVQYRFDENGDTEKVLVNYATYDGENQLTCQAEILAEDLEEGQTLDDLAKKEFDKVARNKIAGWFTSEA